MKREKTHHAFTVSLYSHFTILSETGSDDGPHRWAHFVALCQAVGSPDQISLCFTVAGAEPGSDRLTITGTQQRPHDDTHGASDPAAHRSADGRPHGFAVAVAHQRAN